MKRVFLVPLVIALVSVLVLSACSQPAAPAKPSPAPAPAPGAPTPAPATKAVELKFAHQNPVGSRLNMFFVEPWSKKVEEAAKGNVKITNYPAETLAKAAEMYEAVRGGVADLAWISLGIFPGRFPLTSVTTIPFLNLPAGKVDGKSVSSASVNSRILWELYEKFPEIQKEFPGVKMLFLWSSDPYFLISKKPFRNLDDLKGMKIRELAGPPTEMWKIVGASPINMPPGEVYEAANKGVIDGAGMAWSTLGSFKLYEVFKYRSVADLYLAQFFCIMNQDKWNKLTPDVQQAFTSMSGFVGADFAGNAAFGPDAEKTIRGQMKTAGKEMEDINLDPGQFDKFKQLTAKPLQDKWLADMNAKNLPGQKVLDETLRLLEKYKP